jgi:hypothetical protein
VFAVLNLLMETELLVLPFSIKKILNQEISYECTSLNIAQKHNLIVVEI